MLTHHDGVREVFSRGVRQEDLQFGERRLKHAGTHGHLGEARGYLLETHVEPEENVTPRGCPDVGLEGKDTNFLLSCFGERRDR